MKHMIYASVRVSARSVRVAAVLGLLLMNAPNARAIPIRAWHSVDTLAQAADDNDEAEVPSAEIESYVAVYKAMQRDRSLTVDQAATRQGLTVQAFRELESRVQRDDAALQRARDELQAAALEATPAEHPSRPAPQK